MDVRAVVSFHGLLDAQPGMEAKEKVKVDLSESLNELESLLDQGLIGKEVYEEKKKKILDSL